MWKDFFYYTRTERKGVIALVCIIICCFLASFFIRPRKQPLKHDSSFQRDYQAFVQSLEIINKKEYEKYNHFFQRMKVVLSPFDPNTADSVTFLRLGLPPWMAKNILKYRAKGGKFRKPEDFKKIYGLTDEQFAVLYPYITIHEEATKKDTVRILAQRDTTHLYPVKYTVGTKLEINTTDTAELKKIPGIGSGIAKMIIRYRQQLGGFYSIRQLDEIHLISANIAKWFTVNPAMINRIKINRLGLNRLNAHPYVNFYQAKVIVEHRRKHGTITNLQQLALYEEFCESDFERLKYYISFD